MEIGRVEILSIQFGSKVIDFRLEYSGRKTLGITVTSEMEVVVKAPLGTVLEKVKEKVRKRAPWIITQQSFFLSFHPKTVPRRYVSGETHLYLGKQYRLKVVSDKLEVKREEVKLKGQFLEVFTFDISKAKELVDKWYWDKANEKIEPMAKKLFEAFVSKHHLSLVTYHLSLKSMPMRWGSCTARGKILINPELIKAPKGCIEYVIIHELCHLIYPNHSQKFIALQTREMNDWQKWKNRLEHLLA